MGEHEFLSGRGLIVDDGGQTFALSEVTNTDYADGYYDLVDVPEINTLTMNEPATIAGEITFFNSYEYEKLIGPRWFREFATRWAGFDRKDLSYRMRNAKRKRIRKKYLSRIIEAYRNHLEGR